MIKINRQGTSRITLLTKKYAIKIPTFKSYKLFLCGLLSNLSEKNYIGIEVEDINKIYYGSSLGLVLIQKRVRPVNHRGLFWVALKEAEIKSKFPGWYSNDVKPENYGYNELNKLVRIDLG